MGGQGGVATSRHHQQQRTRALHRSKAANSESRATATVDKTNDATIIYTGVSEGSPTHHRSSHAGTVSEYRTVKA